MRIQKINSQQTFGLRSKENEMIAQGVLEGTRGALSLAGISGVPNKSMLTEITTAYYLKLHEKLPLVDPMNKIIAAFSGK